MKATLHIRYVFIIVARRFGGSSVGTGNLPIHLSDNFILISLVHKPSSHSKEYYSYVVLSNVALYDSVVDYMTDYRTM